VGIKLVSLFLLCATLAGCQSVAPNGPRIADVGHGIEVSRQAAWTVQEIGPPRGKHQYIWTVDGFALNEMVFTTGISRGDPIFPDPQDDYDLPVYHATMLPDEVMELVAASLRKFGYQQLRTDSLHPVPFGTATGFRFSFTYTTDDGLEMKGTAVIAQRGGLDVILFTAPTEYYFDHYLPMVEDVFASIRVFDVDVTIPACEFANALSLSFGCPTPKKTSN